MIYIDLDDVTADFIGYVNKALGTNYPIGVGVSQADWLTIRDSHNRIFADLEPSADFVQIFRRIVETVGPNNAAFLTALPHPDPHCTWAYAPMDKVGWVTQYCIDNGPEYAIPIFLGPYAHDKYKHCEVGDMLIDDNATNCAEWEAAGGIAHLYRTAADCQLFLDTIFNNPED